MTDISIYDTKRMIKNFANKLTRDIYDGTDSRYSRKLQPSLHAKVQRLLDQINASSSLVIDYH